ncbi:MAG TPA: methyltransferase domain-containing protein [Bryobacteraceae bacterium]|nr:methyltransferase domain-containing protein [Bryobacteraceae bacterium]
MAHRVCPWWIGYLLASPLRRLQHDPARILQPYVREGMTVLEPGPGMGFFTLELARLVGASGRVVAVDIQPKMLEALKRRAAKAGLLARVEARLGRADSLGLAGLESAVDFVLAFAMVHEMPSAAAFFAQSAAAMKPGAVMLLAEPAGHVKPADFDEELAAAAGAGLRVAARPHINRSLTAALEKGAL